MELEKLLTDVVGLTEQQVVETMKNKKNVQKIEEIFVEALKHGEVVKGTDKSKLLYRLATKLPKQAQEGRKEVITLFIMNEKIKTNLQLDAGLDYFKVETQNTELDIPAFEKASGVGVEVTDEQIKECILKHFKDKNSEMVEQRYKYNFAKLIADIAKELQWADRKSIVTVVDAEKLNLLGPKTDADNEKPTKGKKDKKATAAKKDSDKKKMTTEPVAEERGFGAAVAALHKVGENHKSDGYVITPNTMRLLEEHKKAVGGKMITRFPPEPNGILHIGHAKAMNFNFNYAKMNDGKCILRYDDTNPAAEEERFFTGILEMAKWLGHEPWKITHSSDYFHELHGYAIELIKRGLAYVDFQTAQEIFEERGGAEKGPRRESPYRNTSVEENLRFFEEMRLGLWDEGTACLRMKMDMTDGNPQLWDLIAYRTKFLPHPRTGEEWCIYPTYDFTHCLVDSLENITHSLCTVEFKQSRISYYWLCNALDVYCPVQWEYSRLDLTNTVLSKRKILKLIEAGVVNAWDDPRLHTLPGLRRRGFPPAAINDLCFKVGITTSMGTTDQALLESCVRNDLNEHAIRTMVVLDPLKITLTNYDGPEYFEAADFPTNVNSPKHKVPFGNVIYIDRNDFQEEIEKGYKRLAKDQPVGLSHSGMVLSVSEIIKDDNGKITELKATYQKRDQSPVKPKAVIHWVSDPLECEIRLYSSLLKDEASGTDFLDQVNFDSVTVVEGALMNKSVAGSEVRKVFQFERVGYFCVDPDSTKDKMVFNLTVSLRDDKGKK